MTTKFLALSDTLGNLVGFELLPGQRHDTVGVAALIEGQDFGALIADKAFDADWIIEELQRREAEVVISQHPKRTAPRDLDREVYKWRHRIENYFGKLKEYKRIAMRACKPALGLTGGPIAISLPWSTLALLSSNRGESQQALMGEVALHG